MSLAKAGLSFLFLLLVAAQPGHASEGNWPEVRALYDSGKWEDAFQLLQKSAPKSPDASHYYNLGTLSLRLGRVGQAVAFLEKANQLSAGGDSDIRKNLETARGSLGHLLGAERLDPGASPVDILLERVAAAQVRGLLSVAALAILLLGFRRYLLFRQPLLLGIGGIFFLLLGASGFFSGILGAHPAAIALAPQVIRSGPGEQFAELAHIAAGVKVRLTGNSILGSATAITSAPPVSNLTAMKEDSTPPPSQPVLWHQIRFSGEGIGWMKETECLFLKDPSN